LVLSFLRNEELSSKELDELKKRIRESAKEETKE